MQSKLKHGLTELLQALDQAGSWLWVWEPGSGECLFTSQALLDLFELHREEMQARPLGWLERVHAEDRVLLQGACDRDKPLLHQPQAFRLLNQPERWLTFTLSSFHTEPGAVLLGLIQDISPEKQLARLQAQQSRHWQALFQNALDAVVLLNPEGMVLYASPSLKRVTGFGPEERMGQLMHGNIHPEDQALAWQMMQRLLQSDLPIEDIHLRVRHKTLEWCWIACNAQNQLKHPDVRAIVVNYRNIQRQKDAEQALQDGHARLNALLNSVDGIIWEAQPEPLRFLFVSQQSQQLLGHAAENWVDDPDFWAAHIHPEEREGVLSECFQATQARQNHVLEYRMRHADGHWVWLRDQVSVVQTAEGLRLRGVMVDISESQQKQLHLQRVQHEMRLNAERLNQVIAYAPHGYLSLRPDGHLTAFNPAAQEMLGNFSEQTLLSQCFWSLFPMMKDRQLKFYTEIQQVAQQQRHVHFRAYYPALDAWFECSAYPCQNEVSVFLRDITASRRNEQVLLLEREMLSASTQAQLDVQKAMLQVLNGIEMIFPQRQACWLKLPELDLPLDTLMLSDARQQLYFEPLVNWARRFNWEQTFQAAPYRLWTLDNALPEVLAEVMKARQMKAVVFYPLWLSDQRLGSVLAIFYPDVQWLTRSLEVDYLERFSLVLAQLLDKCQANADLQLSYERYQLATQATHDVIWDLDLQSQQVVFNALTMAENFGHQNLDIPHYFSWWEEHLHPDDRKQTTSGLYLALASGASHWEAEYRLRCADGSYQFVYDRAYILRGSMREPLRMIGSMQNVTALKTHEQQILTQNQRLMHITWLQSHEVRRPLANLLGLLALLCHELPPDHELLQPLLSEARQLDEIIHEIVSQAQRVQDDENPEI